MDQGLRTQFVTDVSLYNADTLIFIDETECDRRNTISRHGYGVREACTMLEVTCARRNFCNCSYNSEWDFISSDCQRISDVFS